MGVTTPFPPNISCWTKNIDTTTRDWKLFNLSVLNNFDSENVIKAITNPLVNKKDIQSPNRRYDPPKSVSNKNVLDDSSAMNEERGSFVRYIFFDHLISIFNL